MVAIPVVTPVTMPDAEPMAATAASLLDHVPPEGEPVSVVVRPKHTFEDPLTDPEAAFTVATVVAAAAPHEFDIV
jgi:hypothetical protein